MRYRLWSFALAVLAGVPMSRAAPRDAPSQLFEGGDLFGLQWVTEPQIRPDGAQVAYVRIGYDIWTDRPRSSIWLADVNTGAQTPLLSDAGTHASRSWSPDGKRLEGLPSRAPQRSVRWSCRSSHVVAAGNLRGCARICLPANSRQGRAVGREVSIRPQADRRLGSAAAKI
jgi:hypothetical protein